MNNINLLITVVKDLETSFKIYSKSIKSYEDPEKVLQSQLNFLKITKTVGNLFKNNSNDATYKTLKKQAAEIIKKYQRISQSFKDQAVGNTEILYSSFEEDKEVYENQEQVVNKINEERHKEVEAIHKEMIQLNEIFKDFADLTQDQGNMLNKVLYDIECTERTTARVNKELEKAKFWSDQSRRKCCWIFLIIFVVVGVLVGVVAGIYLSKN